MNGEAIMNNSSPPSIYWIVIIAALAVMDVISPMNAFSGALDNPAVGSKGIGMGNSFTAIADDASAVYYNPAGLVFNRKDTWYGELYTYRLTLGHKYTEGSVTSQSTEATFIPGLFISRRYEDWAFGLGYYVPYAGGGSQYNNIVKTGYDRESSAGFAAITPAIAYRLRENLSIGAALSIYMGQMERKKNGIKMEYSGLAGYGGHIGLLYKPADKWRVGFMARSPASVEMDGKVKIAGIKHDSKMEFLLPASFYLGFGYQPNPRLTYSLTVSYRLWGQMDDITTRTEGLGKIKEKTDYRNTWGVASGIEYWITHDLALWTGCIYLQGGTKARGLDPEDCDVNMLDPNLGFAYKITESVELDLSGVYMHGFKKKYGSREYSFQHHLVCLGIRFEI